MRRTPGGTVANRRILILPLLLLAAAALAWMATGGGEPSPDQDPWPVVGSAEAADLPGLPPPATPATLDDGVWPGPFGDLDTDDAESGRQELPMSPSAVAEGPTVLVVGGNPPGPVAGATVAFIARDEGRERDRRSGADTDDLDLPLRYGGKLRTGPDGRAPLPPILQTTLLAATHGDQFASGSLRPGQRGEVRLRLRADETLAVQVLHPDGRPAAGVPVAAFQGHGFGKSHQLWEGRSDRNGLLHARHFQERRRRVEEGKRFAVILRMPLPEPVGAEFEGPRPPAAPVVLTLPPTGVLAVTLVDHTGAPLLCEAHLALGVPRPDGFQVDLPVEGWFEWMSQDKPLGADAVRFAPVGLGLDLRPVGRVGGSRGSWQGEPVAGPRSAGEVRHTTLVLPANFTVLAGRLLLPDGEPAAGLRLSHALGVHGGRTVTGQIATLPDGRFDLALRLANRSGASHLLELRREAADGVDGLRVDTGPLSPGQRRDLGDLRLGHQPMLAQGSCLDDRGEPVAGAEIRVQRYSVTQRGETWTDDPLASATSDAAGAFVLWSAPPPGPFRLRARAGGYFPAESPPLAAGTELRLTLVRVGQVRGQVLLPEWMPDGAASIALVPRGEPRRARSADLHRNRGGRFGIGGLQAGPHEVLVRVRNLPEPVLQLDGLHIAPGDNEDRRLNPLDLRQSVFRYRLRAVGAGGHHLASLQAPVLLRTRRPDGSVQDAAFRWQQGRCELITQSALVELVAFAPGCAPTAVTLGPGDHDVWLQELHPAVIHLPGARALCGPDRAVRVSMIFTGDTGLPQGISGVDQRNGESFSFPRWELGKSSGAWLGHTDTVAVPLTRGGPHEVILRLYEGTDQRGNQASVTVGVADVVVDGPVPVTRTLQLDPAKVAAAVQQLEQARAQREERARARQADPDRGNRRGR